MAAYWDFLLTDIPCSLCFSPRVVVPCAKRRPFLWLRAGIIASVEWLPGLEDGKSNCCWAFFVQQKEVAIFPVDCGGYSPKLMPFASLVIELRGFSGAGVKAHSQGMELKA